MTSRVSGTRGKVVSIVLMTIVGAAIIRFATRPGTSISIPEETAWAARYVGFPYARTLSRAERGDVAALCDLLRFKDTDAASSLGHGVVLRVLCDHLGDAHFANAVQLLAAEDETWRVYSRFEAGMDYGSPSLDPKLMEDLYPLTHAALVRLDHPRRFRD